MNVGVEGVVISISLGIVQGEIMSLYEKGIC